MEAYRRWGTSCFEKFNGMWAILIVDLERKVVVGSRDRIGIKPFYYALDRKRLLFASEPWAIAQVQSGGPAVRKPPVSSSSSAAIRRSRRRSASFAASIRFRPAPGSRSTSRTIGFRSPVFSTTGTWRTTDATARRR